MGLFVYQTHKQDGSQSHCLSSATLELHNNPISKCEQSCDEDGELMSVMSAYFSPSKNNTRELNGSKLNRVVKKTGDVTEVSKFSSVGDSCCRTLEVAAAVDVKGVKMKVAKKTLRKQKHTKADKSVSVLADITDQVSVAVRKPRKQETASSCTICDEPHDKDSKLVSVMNAYCMPSVVVNRSKMKTTLKKTDDIKVKKASKLTSFNDSRCKSSYKTITVAADNVKDVKMQVTDKTARKRKHDKADKPVGTVTDRADQIIVPVTKPRKSKARSSCTGKCTESLRTGKAEFVNTTDQFKSERIKEQGISPSSRCYMDARQSRKMADCGAGGTAACMPVSKVNASEDVKKASKEHGIASLSNFCVTASSRQRTRCFTAGSTLCKHNIAAPRSKFDTTLQSSRTQNDSAVSRKDNSKVDCSQQKKDCAGTAKKTNKQCKYMTRCSDFNITSQVHRSDNPTSGKLAGKQVASRDNCKEVQNDCLQTEEDVDKKPKYAWPPCSDLDTTFQSCERTNFSSHADGLRTKCIDAKTSFHMSLRPCPQRHYAEGTTASVLVSKKCCGPKSDSEHKSQELHLNNDQTMHRWSRNCSHLFSGFQYIITVTAEKLFELFVSVCFLQRNLIEPSRHLLCTENRGYNWLKGCSW